MFHIQLESLDHHQIDQNCHQSSGELQVIELFLGEFEPHCKKPAHVLYLVYNCITIIQQADNLIIDRIPTNIQLKCRLCFVSQMQTNRMQRKIHFIQIIVFELNLYALGIFLEKR